MVDGHRSEAWVKASDGADLVSTWDAYLNNRRIRVPKGVYTLTDELTIPDCHTPRTIILEGDGYEDTIIQGAAGLSACITSLQDSWHSGAGTVLILKNIQFKGQQTMPYVLYLPYIQLELEGTVEVGGYLEDAGIYLKISGSGICGNGVSWNHLIINSLTDHIACIGIDMVGEAVDIGNLEIICSSGILGTGLVTRTGSYHIGMLAGYIGNGKELTRLLHNHTTLVKIDNIRLGADGTPAVNPYVVQSGEGGMVEIDTLWETLRICQPTYYEDAETRKCCILHNFELVGTTSSGTTKENPGVAYVDFGSTEFQTVIDVSDFNYAKIMVDDGRATEDNGAGNPSGLEWYNVTDAAALCAVVEWHDAGTNVPRLGTWTDISALSGQKDIHLYCKGSSATDDITVVFHVLLWFRDWRPAT